MAKPRIIGLLGRKQSGKDTVCGLISEFIPCTRIAFADPLREEVRRVLACLDPIPDDAPELLKVFLRAEIEDIAASERPAPDALCHPYSDRIRRILQWWGTEYRRVQQDDYWLARFRDAIMAAPESLFVVTDVRFSNEADAVREAGGVLWRITRPAADARVDSHISERQIDTIKPCIVLENRWGVDELRVNVKMALKLSGLLP